MLLFYTYKELLCQKLILTLTNKVLARLNEVQLTSSNFTNARGIQVQAQNAVNESVRYINQREFNYPFNHSTETETLNCRCCKI